MSESHQLPADLKEFIESETWTFAKTMPEWPHEYLVRGRVDSELFQRLVIFIRETGVEGSFYQRKFTYFAEDGWLYWTMGEPIPETAIINRCKQIDSYEHRRRKGTLPDHTAYQNKNRTST